jgi:hypothetical protein
MTFDGLTIDAGKAVPPPKRSGRRPSASLVEEGIKRSRSLKGSEHAAKHPSAVAKEGAQRRKEVAARKGAEGAARRRQRREPEEMERPKKATHRDNSLAILKHSDLQTASPADKIVMKRRRPRQEGEEAMDALRAEAEEENRKREEAAARIRTEAAIRERESLEQEELERQKRAAEGVRQQRLRNDQARERRGAEQRHSQSRDRRDDRSPDARSEMTAAIAAEILGIDAGATREEVRLAYGRLMKRVHPDLGGSAFLAKQLNIARDRLCVGPVVATPRRAATPPTTKPARASSKTKLALVAVALLSLVAIVSACAMVLLD